MQETYAGKGGTHRAQYAGKAAKEIRNGRSYRWAGLVAKQVRKEGGWTRLVGQAGKEDLRHSRQENSDPELHRHPLSNTPVYSHWPHSNTKLIHTLCLYIFQVKDTKHDTLSFPLQTTHKLM